ncbi:MAG TPA: uracil-DNA glycosylase family protein [Paucimonas sp.]|nr:uracil-DNA glycosylase family protein [Paucimonas sp.]
MTLPIPMPDRQPLSILRDIAACRLCAAHLPHGPRPVVQASASARLLIVGQAPGRRVHETGVPWDDPSGDLLRAWLQLTPAQFYDARRIAIVPTGFCYPGKGASGDLPPRPECAPRWHAPLLEAMPEVRLTLLIGSHAQAYYLQQARQPTLTDTVANYAACLPRFFPLPHPSPRNRYWFIRHPWFARDVLPALRAQVAAALAD